MLVGWTGHRPDVFQSADEARRRLDDLVERVLERRPNAEFLCGGQRGVDAWAASAAAERGVPFRIVLPMAPEAFTRDWSGADRDTLSALIARAIDVRVVDEEGWLGPLAYDRRNEVVAQESDLLVAVW